MKITVSKATGRKANQMHVSAEAANILRGYPRRETVFAMIEDDEGEEQPAIGIMPETSIRTGYVLMDRKKGKGQGMTGSCPKDILEIGEYSMSEIPVFEDQIDWYLLNRKT